MTHTNTRTTVFGKGAWAGRVPPVGWRINKGTVAEPCGSNDQNHDWWRVLCWLLLLLGGDCSVGVVGIEMRFRWRLCYWFPYIKTLFESICVGVVVGGECGSW